MKVFFKKIFRQWSNFDFSEPVVGVVVLFTALVYYYNTRFILEPDDINYISFSSYILSNQGKIPEVYINDFSVVNSIPMIGYPWGTMLILALLQWCFSVSALNAFVIVRSFCVLIFYCLFKSFVGKLSNQNLTASQNVLIAFFVFAHFGYFESKLSF